MSLMLCRQENAEHPYYMDALGVHIYTSQELCYVIYHHPLLVMEDFVDDHLIDFIRTELNMAYLASRLEKWKKSEENQDELLLIILQECFYYKPAEVVEFRQQVAGLRKKHPADYCKMRADYMLGLKQYGKAIPIYEKALEFPRDGAVNDEFLGRVWCNKGSCYARMFQSEKAVQSFERAYYYLKDISVIQKMYYMKILNDKIVLKEKFEKLMTEELKKKWDEELQGARERAAETKAVKQLEHMFTLDPIKRNEGARKLIHKWKQEYRNMI